MPDPYAEQKLARIRKYIVEFGRLVSAAEPGDFPTEVHRFLGGAGAILGIPFEEYRS